MQKQLHLVCIWRIAQTNNLFQKGRDEHETNY